MVGNLKTADVPDLSLRMIAAFLEIYRERSVSRAALRLGMTQPAVSMTLTKLRAMLNDPLFIRSNTGMRPTPRADELAALFASTLQLVEEALQPVTFDAQTSNRTFNVGMTEVTQAMMLPAVLEILRSQGPQITLNAIKIEKSSLDLLENGNLDCVVGYFPDMISGLYEQTLLERDFVCVASRSHPRIQNAISLEQFFDEKHVSTASFGSGTVLADAVIDAGTRRRGIKVMVGDIYAVHMVVANSEFIATISRPVANLFRQADKINIFEHPVKLPRYQVKLHWHERYHHDAGSIWFRRLVSDVFRERGRFPAL